MSKQWRGEVFFNGLMEERYQVSQVLHRERSQFQEIEVLDTEALGKVLLLDGKGMLCDRDEFIYHEVMAHIPMCTLKKPKRALVIGGGDGGVVRELCRHPELEAIHLVEIDQRVIDVCREFFPHITSGLDDPRVQVFAEDGLAFVKNAKERFCAGYDFIAVDSTDPEDFAEGLFTKEFYGDLSKLLGDEGIMINQTENPFFDQYGIRSIYQNMRQEFAHVKSLSAPMLMSPGTFWTFGVSSQSDQIGGFNAQKQDWYEKNQNQLKWYNPEWHEGSFMISNFHKSFVQ